MRPVFYVILTVVLILVLSSGVGALIIVIQGGAELTDPQQRLLDVFLTIVAAGASAFVLLLTAHLTLNK